MTELVLNQEQLKKLDTLLAELPFKYASPLVNLLNMIARENMEAQKAAPQELPKSPTPDPVKE